MNTCRFGILGTGSIANYFCNSVKLAEEVVRCVREGRRYSDTMSPEATIECAQIFDKLLRGTP